MRKITHVTLLFIFGLAVSLNLCRAQNSFGTILGYVHDQSGLPVSGASVKVTNTATGVVSTARTQPDGNYTVINLVPGSYMVSTEVKGFAKIETQPTQLVVNQILRVDLTLRPGAITQTVTVTAEGALIDTDTAAISEEVSQREVADLPLISGNVIDLAELSPGVVSDPNGTRGGFATSYRSSLSGGDLYTGGNAGSSNGYLIDGVDDNDPGFQTPTITPPISDIQDFRLMNKDYSAEYGGSAAQINIATKSGTNDFHGTAYEYARNDAMDAVPDFALENPLTGAAKPELRYNLFGVAAGGPVWIPHLVNGRNRLFFFADYQGIRSHTVSPGFGYFPTPAELSGDFSADPTIYEPGTATPIPGNKIQNYQPIDPTAAKMIAAGIFPHTAPTVLTGIDYVVPLNAPDNTDEYNIRIDAHLGQKDSLFARFSSSDEHYVEPGINGQDGPFSGVDGQQSGKNIAVDYTHIFTTNFINDLRFGLNRPISLVNQPSSGGSDNITGSVFNNIPSNPLYWGAPDMYLTGYSTVGGYPLSPVDYITTDAKLSDMVTWTHGPHTIQAGLYVGKIRYKEVDSILVNGLLEDLGLYTSGLGRSSGNSMADLLLGDDWLVEEYQGAATMWMNSWAEGGFINDIYKLSNRLTLNLGGRYDYTAPMREEDNRGSMFDPTYPGGRLVTANMVGVTAANSPLVGYTPVRDSFEPTKTDWSPRVGISYRPFGNTVIRTGYGIYYDANQYNEYFLPALNYPFDVSYEKIDLTYFSNPVKLSSLYPALTPTPVAGTIGAYTLNRKNRTPYVQQWNFDIEHQLPGNIVSEVGYMGSEGTKEQDRREEDQGILSAPGGTVTIPYTNFASVLVDENELSSNYNALFGRFEKRFSHGFSLLATYTYSKVLTTQSDSVGIGNSTGYMNGWDKHADYGPAGYDMRQSFVFSPIWELPFGRGRMLAPNAPPVLNALIGGWQAEGIFTAHTGAPYAVLGTDKSGTNSALARMQVVGNPWGPHAAGLAFNTAAFAEPATHTFGNEGNNMMTGLGMNNSDFSMMKNTTIHDSLGFQLRFEFFNVFNQEDIGPYPSFSITSPSFGHYDGVQEGARTIQVAANINF